MWNVNPIFYEKEEGFDDFEAMSYYNSIFDSESYEDSAVVEFLRTCGKVKLIYGYGGE